VLHDPLAHFKRQVQPGKFRIAMLELLHRSQRVQVVVKLVAMFLHGRVQNALARMAERRMPNVMHQRQRFHQVFIQLQLGGNGA
jgi:hypothetical protein